MTHLERLHDIKEKPTTKNLQSKKNKKFYEVNSNRNSQHNYDIKCKYGNIFMS